MSVAYALIAIVGSGLVGAALWPILGAWAILAAWAFGNVACLFAAGFGMWARNSRPDRLDALTDEMVADLRRAVAVARRTDSVDPGVSSNDIRRAS